jgi:hypothetical protein
MARKSADPGIDIARIWDVFRSNDCFAVASRPEGVPKGHSGVTAGSHGKSRDVAAKALL